MVSTLITSPLNTLVLDHKELIERISQTKRRLNDVYMSFFWHDCHSLKDLTLLLELLFFVFLISDREGICLVRTMYVIMLHFFVNKWILSLIYNSTFCHFTWSLRKSTGNMTIWVWNEGVIRINAKKEMCCKNKITVQYVKNDNENLVWKD